MEDRKIRIAITHGDTNAIGYELIFKTFIIFQNARFALFKTLRAFYIISFLRHLLF